MAESPHRPHRLRFRNALTGEVRVVRFGPEVRALKAERHPALSHVDLWEQVHQPATPKEGNQ